MKDASKKTGLSALKVFFILPKTFSLVCSKIYSMKLKISSMTFQSIKAKKYLLKTSY